MKTNLLLLILTLSLLSCQQNQLPVKKGVNMYINLEDTVAPMDAVWAWFGYDERSTCTIRSNREFA